MGASTSTRRSHHRRWHSCHLHGSWRLGHCHCAHALHILVFQSFILESLILLYIYVTVASNYVQVNNMGGVTIPWGKASGDKAVDDSALKGAWEKAVKVAGWPWYGRAMQSIEPNLMMCPCWFGRLIVLLYLETTALWENPHSLASTHMTSTLLLWPNIVPVFCCCKRQFWCESCTVIGKNADFMVSMYIYIYVREWGLKPRPARRASSAGSTGCGASEPPRQPQVQGGTYIIGQYWTWF